MLFNLMRYTGYTQATLKLMELDTQAQQCEAAVHGRSLTPIPASVYRYNLQVLGIVFWW
ncbi:MAG: hypothetical protein LBJ00_14480 [Planctomycetaceae bacterium]|nr:hypothetical protein [Planctomycetaceae bacterium]